MNLIELDIQFINEKYPNSKIIPLQKEASSRTYFKIETENESLVVCKYPKFTSKEYSFLVVNEFLENNNISVPKIILINEKLNLIFQEDLGTTDLTSLNDEEYFKELKKSILLLTKLQTLKPNSLIESKSFDKEKNFFELNHTINGFNELKEFYHFKTELSIEVVSFLESASIFLANYSEKVITHRDFHARNIMLNQNEQVIIDFQDMMMGTPYYDLASILYDAYRIIPLFKREELYKFFIENSKIKLERKREYYLTQCLQRSFKALGSYLVLFHKEKKEKYKESLIPCLDNLIEIVQVGKFPDSLYLFFTSFKEELTQSGIIF